MAFEPYWEPDRESWPGIFDAGTGKRLKGDIFYHSHIGAWCEWDERAGLGLVPLLELQFAENGRFVWLQLTGAYGTHRMVRREGRWKLNTDTLTLQIDHAELPDCMPRHLAEMRIFDRQGRLGLEVIRIDDDQRDGICKYFLLPARAGDAEIVLNRAIANGQRAIDVLPAPFFAIETMLRMVIPQWVQELALSDPIFCMRIYYYDTHAPREGFGLSLRILTEPLRKQLLKTKRSPACLADELWQPQSGIANGARGLKGLHEVSLSRSPELAKLFGQVYDLLCVSEDINMPFLRELARRISRRLNARNWEQQTPITDDFVVFPADGSGFFGGEYFDDLAAAVSDDRVKLLQNRGYIV